jgi:hypothetical protein
MSNPFEVSPAAAQHPIFDLTNAEVRMPAAC